MTTKPHIPTAAESASDEKQTGRVEAFSDGVFAIAITLLVLELKTPHIPAMPPAEHGPPTAAWLCEELLKEWPSYIAFITSFLSVLIMWMHHHAMFKLVKRVSPALLLANGVLLLAVSIVPFPTAVVAEYMTTPAASTAAALYSGAFVFVALTFVAVLLTALRPECLAADADPKVVRTFRRTYWIGPPCYGLALAAAAFNPWISMAICTALWMLWAGMMLPRRKA